MMVHQSHLRCHVLEGRAGAGTKPPAASQGGLRLKLIEEQPGRNIGLLSAPTLLSWILRQQHPSARSWESTALSQL